MRYAALTIAILLGGCSFILSTTPPGMTHSCMPDRTGPEIDAAIVGAALLIDAILLASASTAMGHDNDGGAIVAATAGLISIPIVLPYGISALYGYGKEICPRR